MVFVITEHCLSLKIVLEKRLRGKDILEEKRKFILNGYRFEDDKIRFVHNEDASLSFRSYSDSSSLSSKCMPIRMFVTIPVPQFQEYSRQSTFFKYWRSHQDYCGLQLHHRGSSEASYSHHTLWWSKTLTRRRLWWQWLLFVHVVTSVRNAQTTVASFFGLHFRCVWFIGPIITALQL